MIALIVSKARRWAQKRSQKQEPASSCLPNQLEQQYQTKKSGVLYFFDEPKNF
ncbi:hypothetical protein [Pseudodesulfovibrio indicus]|uniref:hypothetical protein n=1 Tax=Pseudodesulfovibrio indicus TaxID=1716143 RepID=UPI00130E97A5|nr:hypothetical protein [Pseudodesulfovibrio indicus]